MTWKRCNKRLATYYAKCDVISRQNKKNQAEIPNQEDAAPKN